jgi:hypothetical protein
MQAYPGDLITFINLRERKADYLGLEWSTRTTFDPDSEGYICGTCDDSNEWTSTDQSERRKQIRDHGCMMKPNAADLAWVYDNNGRICKSIRESSWTEINQEKAAMKDEFGPEGDQRSRSVIV